MQDILNVINMIVVYFVAYRYAASLYRTNKFNNLGEGNIDEQADQRGFKRRSDDTDKSFRDRVLRKRRHAGNDPFGFQDDENIRQLYRNRRGYCQLDEPDKC